MTLNSNVKFERRKTNLRFENDMRNLANFDQSTWEWLEALGLWWDPSIQSRKCMNLKFTE